MRHEGRNALKFLKGCIGKTRRHAGPVRSNG